VTDTDSSVKTAIGDKLLNFTDLGLMPRIVRTLEKKGYRKPTPIQEQSIPELLKGRDILGGAQTGTGKTAAFALPVIQLLHGAKPGTPAPKVLVLTPTRELAAQVGESFRLYSAGLNLRTEVVFGGVNINPQKDALRRGTDVLVATPGRLLDHISQKTVRLNKVGILVLDEADRMLDMGFLPDIKKILNRLPEKRQNMLFSATYADEIRRLAEGLLVNPVKVEVAARNTAAETVSQVVYPVSREQKKDLLAHLIMDGNWHQVLIFSRTKRGADRLAKRLNKQGIPSAPIHGDKSQNARTRALRDFKKGKVQTLVATDIAARGLDIRELPYVVNFDLPQVPEDYIHRIGRTGRAGSEGIASSLVSADECDKLRAIEKLLKKPLETRQVDDFSYTETVEFPIQAEKTKASPSGRGRRYGGRRGRSGRR
jgi:ATP-dependent RNA helicase RhlE